MTPREAARVVAREPSTHLDLLTELGIELDSCPPDEAFVLVEREGLLFGSKDSWRRSQFAAG